MSSKIADFGFVKAYLIFIAAGWALAVAGCGLVAGWGDLAASIKEFFWVLVQSGPAAALGAAAVHRPFMRALRDGRAHHVHGWALLGVVAAHVAYAALVFLTVLVDGGHLRNHLLEAQQWPAALREAGAMAMLAGSFSLILGFLPNVVIAEAFAGVLVYLQRRRVVRDVQAMQEGGCDASAAFAE